MIRNIIKFLYKRFFTEEPTTELDLLNFTQLFMLTGGRCNYHSTVQGIILGHTLRNYINSAVPAPWNDVIGDIFWVYEIIVTLADDLWVLATAGVSFSQHFDPYNGARIIGKLIKMSIQYKLYGFLNFVVHY